MQSLGGTTFGSLNHKGSLIAIGEGHEIKNAIGHVGSVIKAVNSGKGAARAVAKAKLKASGSKSPKKA